MLPHPAKGQLDIQVCGRQLRGGDHHAAGGAGLRVDDKEWRQRDASQAHHLAVHHDDVHCPDQPHHWPRY